MNSFLRAYIYESEGDENCEVCQSHYDELQSVAANDQHGLVAAEWERPNPVEFTVCTLLKDGPTIERLCQFHYGEWWKYWSEVACPRRDFVLVDGVCKPCNI